MLKQFQKRPDRAIQSILSTPLRLEMEKEKNTEAKANRIINGCRNHNVPVDMGDNFYENGNEHCKYLITDPRSDVYLRTSKKVSK